MSSLTKLSYRTLRQISLSHPLWILLWSILVQCLVEMDSSLFGLNPNEPLRSSLAFSPLNPWRELGLTLFSFSLVHESWTHWAMCLVFFVALSLRVNNRIHRGGYLFHSLVFFAHGLASALIAISFLLPFAPQAHEGDRILGMSAIVLMNLGVLVSLRPKAFDWILLVALGCSYFFLSNGSPLANWGHLAGFLLGILLGITGRRLLPA